MDGASEVSTEREKGHEEPGAVCVVRDTVTGEFFTAVDHEAKDCPVRELHYLVLERVWAACEVVGFHRHLRRERAALGRGLTTAQIAEQLSLDHAQLRRALMEWPLAPCAGGADTWEHFLRVQGWIARMELHSGRSFVEGDWEGLLSANGNHAEVKAVSEALNKLDAKDSAAFLRMELYLESGEEGVDKALPRCVHCRFVTDGVIPTADVRRVELEIDQG